MAPVPPVLVWTLGALGAALVAKLLAKAWRRGGADRDRVKSAPASEVKREAAPTLRRDPVTGIYRP
jgi:hypothetical protein